MSLVTLLKKNWFVFLLLAVLVFVVYANSLGNGLVTDDEGLAKEGSNLATWARIFSSPEAVVRLMVYALVYLFAGVQAWALRLSNILFHIGSTFLAYLIIKKIINQKVAILTAAIFSVHPLISEAVVWISAGGYVQYSFFFLLSFWLYLNSTKKLNYYLSIVFFILSLGSLNRGLVLGFIFPIYEISFAHKTGGLRKNWKKVAPYLVISFLWLATFANLVTSRATSLDKIYYRDGRFYNPLLQWPLAIGSYISLLFWPAHLTYVHTNSQSALGLFLRSLILLGYFGSMIWSYLKNKTIFFWLCWFLIPLLPFLTPLKIAFIVAERYSYLSSLGIIVLFSYLLIRLTRIKELKILVYFLAVLLVIGLGIRTMVRNTDWKDANTLWKKTAEVSGDSSQAHLNNGVKLGNERDYAAAEKEFIAAIQINPKVPEFYFNLGVLYLKTGHKDKAHEQFQKAVELRSDYKDAQKGLELTK